MTTPTPNAARIDELRGRLFIVTYLEVAPAAVETTAALLDQWAGASREAIGNLRCEVLQRTDPTNHFLVLAAWRDESTFDASRQATHTNVFAQSSAPLLVSAIDERRHTALALEELPAQPQAGDVYVVTHVDVPPPHKDACVELLTTLGQHSRDEPGCLRFDVLQQTDRPNHFSLIQSWQSQNDYDAHITAGHTTAFRRDLTPISGAPYDERRYVLPPPD